MCVLYGGRFLKLLKEMNGVNRMDDFIKMCMEINDGGRKRNEVCSCDGFF